MRMSQRLFSRKYVDSHVNLHLVTVEDGQFLSTMGVNIGVVTIKETCKEKSKCFYSIFTKHQVKTFSKMKGMPYQVTTCPYCFILHLPFPNPKRLCLLRLVLCLSLLPLACRP